MRGGLRSVDLDDTGAFNDGRFFLPFGEVLGALAVDIDARKFFTVVVINGDLPVAVLSPAVPLETGGIPSFLLTHDDFSPPMAAGKYCKFAPHAQVAS